MLSGPSYTEKAKRRRPCARGRLRLLDRRRQVLTAIPADTRRGGARTDRRQRERPSVGILTCSKRGSASVRTGCISTLRWPRIQSRRMPVVTGTRLSRRTAGSWRGRAANLRRPSARTWPCYALPCGSCASVGCRGRVDAVRMRLAGGWRNCHLQTDPTSVAQAQVKPERQDYFVVLIPFACGPETKALVKRESGRGGRSTGSGGMGRLAHVAR